jgi:hypothetical protein
LYCSKQLLLSTTPRASGVGVIPSLHGKPF